MRVLKLKKLKNNPYAYILLGYNETTNNSFVEIEANIEIVEDQKVIDWLWETQDKTFFDSKEDPNLWLMNDDDIDTPVTITV